MSLAPEIIKNKSSSIGYYADAPSWDSKKCAAIGNFELNDPQEGQAVLKFAIDRARAEGMAALLGPMNGDTWHSYRAVLETDDSPPFLLEPQSGPLDLECLQATGFLPVSHYVSTRGDLEAALGAAPVSVDGINITAWDGQDGEALVEHIFNMSKDSFAKNRFFKPVTLANFQEIYHPLLGAVDPRFVLIARTTSGVICGFLFGFPDQSAPADNPTVILKTYASGMRGVGHALADRFHRNALDMEFKSVIHALMHEDNISLQRSRQHKASVFRRYVLMARTL